MTFARLTVLIIGLVIGGMAAYWISNQTEEVQLVTDAGPVPSSGGEDGDLTHADASRSERVPTITRGPVDLMGDLSTVEVESVLDTGLADLEACYQNALGTSPSLQGATTMNVMIGRDGSVGVAFLIGSTLDNQPMEECLTDAADAWRFPPGVSGVTRLLIPYVFGAR